MIFTQAQLEAFFFDPVMAASVIMGADLDTFQRIRLRCYWWYGSVTDNSGVGTGKTLVNFVFLNLRCILIPGHYAAVYFPSMSIGQQTFWNKFADFEESAPIFREQFHMSQRKQEDEKYNAKTPGAWVRTYKNGSKLFMPAPDWKGDAKGQASRDFNTVLVDDYLRASDMGEGLDKQVIDRARRPTSRYNKNHNLWGNKVHLLGHAEGPTHKEFKRYRAYQASIRAGSTRDCCITFCYLDWSPKYAKTLRDDSLIDSQKRTLSADQFRRQYLGLWSAGGDTYYPLTILPCRPGLNPQLWRRSEHERFFLGQDTAQPNANAKADYSAWDVLRAVELDSPALANFIFDQRYFHLAFVFAHMLQNRTAGQLAGFTHALDRMFEGLEAVMLDPLGGGLFVLTELRKEVQLIENTPTIVRPMTTVDDAFGENRRGIITLFNRKYLGSTVRVRPENADFMKGDEGLLEWAHKEFQSALAFGGPSFPQPAIDRQMIVRSWPSRFQRALYHLDLTRLQLASIRLMKNSTGSTFRNPRGFVKFLVVNEKKDLAYSAMYAFIAFVNALEKEKLMGGVNGQGVCFS